MPVHHNKLLIKVIIIIIAIYLQWGVLQHSQ
jgi:hypothetical protein